MVFIVMLKFLIILKRKTLYLYIIIMNTNDMSLFFYIQNE